MAAGHVFGLTGTATIDRTTVTADQPGSWLVLYNLADADSVAWATWYQQRRQIPAENMLGLVTSTDEHLVDSSAMEAQIFNPVKEYLQDNPELEQHIIGIIPGYRIPGHYGNPPLGPGGRAVASALQDLKDLNDDWSKPFPPHPGSPLPEERLTKADMPPDLYMVARIDAPTLDLAKELTRRADALDSEPYFLPPHVVWYDWYDPALTVPCHCWYWLQQTVDPNTFPDVPWAEFDSDTEQTPWAAMRFGTHDVDGWNDSRLRGTPEGPLILAYNLNSWGATTVRSTTAEGGRFVPNAIDAGYAAAVGATGEPGTIISPMPDTLLAGLREGWTLGESFYLSNPRNDWMWILVGDPFLRIPYWFGTPIPGDFDQDGDVDVQDFGEFQLCFDGADKPPASTCHFAEEADLDGDGDVDVSDLAIFNSNFTGAY